MWTGSVAVVLLRPTAVTAVTVAAVATVVSGALRCCNRVLLEVVSFDTHSLSAGPDLLHGVRNVVRQVS
jgi:hypothetical protein